MEVLGVSLDPTVDLGRVDYNFKMFKDGDGTVTVGGTGSRTAHVSSHDCLWCSPARISSPSPPLPPINGNSTPYISRSKSGRVSEFLVLSHSFQNVQSCTRNHSVPQITVSLVRQTAHNVHVACIASCIHVTKNSNNAIPLLALHRASHTQL